MALNRKYISTNEKVETAIIQHLRYKGGFKGCAVVSHGLGLEAPDKLPCLIVHCESVERHADYPNAMAARQGTVTVTLYGDSEQMTQAAFEKYAREMEARMFTTTGMQQWFNPPASGRDTRKIRGLYLHEVTDRQTDSTTDGTGWRFAITVTLFFQSNEDQD